MMINHQITHNHKIIHKTINNPKIIHDHDNNPVSLVILDNKVLDLSLNNVPSLFNKKSHQRLIKPSVYMKIPTGIPRHFTPAAQE